MSKKNVTAEVKKRIEELINNKREELTVLNQKKNEAMEQKAAAEEAIEKATAIMDLESYEEAIKSKHTAQLAIDMYSGKYRQLSNQEYISEEESDKVIDSLLAYEDTLTEDFKAAIKEPLEQLEKIQKAYSEAVEETEKTIRTWEENIHANYSTRGKAIYTDKETGLTTDRSDIPVLVHVVPFRGCDESIRLYRFLKDEPTYNVV